MSDQTTNEAAALWALAGSMIDGKLSTSRRHLRAMAGLATMDELHAAERGLQGQGLIGPTSTRGNRWAVDYRLTRRGRELVGALPRSTDETIPEALRAHEWADAGALWGRAPKGEPVDTRELLALMPEVNLNMVYRLVRKLAALPVPVATITRQADGTGWVHGFHEPDADEWRIVADHIDGQQDTGAIGRAA